MGASKLANSCQIASVISVGFSRFMKSASLVFLDSPRDGTVVSRRGQPMRRNVLGKLMVSRSIGPHHEKKKIRFAGMESRFQRCEARIRDRSGGQACVLVGIVRICTGQI